MVTYQTWQPSMWVRPCNTSNLVDKTTQRRKKTAELLYKDGWESREAVFDPICSAGQAKEYPYNEDVLKKYTLRWL